VAVTRWHHDPRDKDKVFGIIIGAELLSNGVASTCVALTALCSTRVHHSEPFHTLPLPSCLSTFSLFSRAPHECTTVSLFTPFPRSSRLCICSFSLFSRAPTRVHHSELFHTLPFLTVFVRLHSFLERLQNMSLLCTLCGRRLSDGVASTH
jgi:hypothetical protein